MCTIIAYEPLPSVGSMLKACPRRQLWRGVAIFSIGGVRPYERTTEMQKKQVSDMIVIASVKTKSVDNDTENDGKEVNFRTCKDVHLTLQLTKLSLFSNFLFHLLSF